MEDVKVVVGYVHASDELMADAEVWRDAMKRGADLPWPEDIDEDDWDDEED